MIPKEGDLIQYTSPNGDDISGVVLAIYHDQERVENVDGKLVGQIDGLKMTLTFKKDVPADLRFGAWVQVEDEQRFIAGVPIKILSPYKDRRD